MSTQEPDAAAEPIDGVGTATVEQLRQDIAGEGVATPTPETTVDDIVEELFPGEAFSFDEAVVKDDLRELLVSLVAVRDSETHGQALMDDLGEAFDTELSPGTVYPLLHDLEEEGLLERHELVRTKAYFVDGESDARDEIEDAMRQHLALGFFYYAALAEL